jgi:hypothetical protein
MVENENQTQMDEAANAAERELASIMNELDEIQKKGAKAIFRWFATNYMKAGYKRLAKVCVKFSTKDFG